MKLIKNYFLLLILKLTVLFKLINSNELPKNNTKLLIQRNDYTYHDKSCKSENYYDCGSFTNLFCDQTSNTCQCKSNFKWNSENLICSATCIYYSECDVYNKNQKCYNGMCVCKVGYEGILRDDACKECNSNSDCSTLKPRCNYFKCESCPYGQSYSKSAEMCEYDNEYSYSYNWAYYLWFLILIPIMIVVSAVYCCWRRRVTPGAVIISNTQLYGQQQQQFPPPPPPYAETNTYRY